MSSYVGLYSPSCREFCQGHTVREVDAMLASQIEVFESLLMSFDTKIKNVNILFTYL